MDARVVPLTLELREPLHAAHGTTTTRELLLLRLESEQGLIGWGEAAPLASYDGVELEDCRAALEAQATALRALSPGGGGAAALDAARAAADLPQALAAVDLALWDAAARREDVPVAHMLSGDPAASVEVNATVGAADRATAAEQATAARDAGFGCVKVKVGLGDDAGRVAAVRAAAGPQMLLRLDANGAWTVDEAVAAIGALEGAGLELVEEPVHGVAELRAVRDRVATRIAMDETAAQHGAISSGAADAICLKLGRAGGISALLAQATLVRTTGADAYLASTLDGPLGIAAAVHAAAALRIGPACGLATLGLFTAPVPVALRPAGGMIAVPAGPGLGVDPAALFGL